MSASSAQLRKETHTAGSGGWAILVGLGALFLLALIGWGVWAGIVEPNTRHAEQTQAARVAAENQAVIEMSLAKTQLALQVTLPAEQILPTHTPAMLPSATAYPTFQPHPAGMVRIPAGSFTMGSSSGFGDERPTHQVSLDAFYMDVYEVANDSFAIFVRAANYRTDAEEDGWSYVYTDGSWVRTNGADWQHPQGPGSDLVDLGKHPVIHVSWNDAKAYCEWAGGRLPTEAEWEYAARGGLDSRLYPWGDESPLCQAGAENGANFWDCSNGGTTEVGSYAPNGYGLYDMAGNVWEWVSSLYQPYPYDAQDGRENLSASGSRVLRGGSWDGNAYYLRIAYRGQGDPSYRYSGKLGFRCARTP